MTFMPKDGLLRCVNSYWTAQNQEDCILHLSPFVPLTEKLLSFAESSLFALSYWFRPGLTPKMEITTTKCSLFSVPSHLKIAIQLP